MKRITAFYLCICSLAAHAQTGLVPPSQAELRERERRAVNDTVKEGVLHAPTSIIRAAAIANQAVGETGSNIILQGAGTASRRVFGAVGAVADLAAGYSEGGADGMMRAGQQVIINEGAQAAGQAAAHQYILWRMGAASAAPSAATAAGAAGIAFSAGWVGGTYIRNSTGIGDKVDDWWVNTTPDWAKKQLVEGYDPDRNRAVLSPPVPNQARRDMFNRIAAENAEQERQRQAAAAAAAANSTPVSSSTSDDGSAAFATFMQGVLQQYQQNQLNRTPVVAGGNSGAAANSCQLDPKTGCHYGHDEKSHPGGCKQCGGSSAR